MTESKKEIPPETKQDSGKGKRSDKYDEKLNLESPDNPVDKKTARWIEEQNEFLEKKRKRGQMKIREKGMYQSSIQMALLRSCRGKELLVILVMSNHPGIQ